MDRRQKQKMRLGVLRILLIAGIFGGILGGIFFFGPYALFSQEEKNSPLPQTMDSLKNQPVHPAFTFSKNELLSTANRSLKALSPQISASEGDEILNHIEQKPKQFLAYFGAMLAEEDQMLFALVDKQHSLPANYVPAGLVHLNEYQNLTLNRQDLSLRQKIVPDLFAMVTAAAKSDIVLAISSTYRSYTYQEGLFQRHLDQLGLKEAERVSARAGSSQHQLGTTIDFGSVTIGFATHPAGIWLAETAWQFGFSLSYPQGYEHSTGYSYEPWHFRYLGRAPLELQRTFFLGIQQYLLLFYDLTLPSLRKGLLESMS